MSRATNDLSACGNWRTDDHVFLQTVFVVIIILIIAIGWSYALLFVTMLVSLTVKYFASRFTRFQEIRVSLANHGTRAKAFTGVRACMRRTVRSVQSANYDYAQKPAWSG
jgi:hypothetical protein